MTEENKEKPEDSALLYFGDACDAIQQQLAANTTLPKDADIAGLFERGYKELHSEFTLAELETIKVPEDKIAGIVNSIVAEAVKKADNSKFPAEKAEVAFGTIGLVGLLTAGLKDKAREDALVKAKTAFLKDLPEDKVKDAEALFDTLVEDAKKQASKGKAGTWTKVGATAIGAAAVYAGFKGFKSKEVTNENGEVEKKSSSWFSKILGTLAIVAGAMFAYKVAGQGKEMGAALKEMNPVSFVSKLMKSREAQNVVAKGI